MIPSKPFTLLILAFCFAHISAGQGDSLLIKRLITDIAFMQVRDTDPDFFEGTFPSSRECAGIPHNHQPDYNIFYTAAIGFTLRNLSPGLQGENKLIAEEIVQRATASYHHYQDRNGYPFYAFWPTGYPVLPHSFFWYKMSDAFNRGNDADDTVLILMSMNAGDSVCKIVKQRMTEVSNLFRPTRKINTTYKELRSVAAHSTYLGLKSPPDFDFGVHCNLLYFSFDRNLPLTKQDSSTIDLLQQMVSQRMYLKSPVFISPYYVTRPILLYHLARLMGRFHIPALDKYRSQIIADAKKELGRSRELMDQIVLSTSLLRLGERPGDLRISINDIETITTTNYSFCQARAAYNFPLPLKQLFLHWRYMVYYFYCPAYNKMLLLEYLLERNKYDSSK